MAPRQRVPKTQVPAKGPKMTPRGPKRTPNTNPQSQTRTNVDRGFRNGRPRVTLQLEGKMADLYQGNITIADMDDDELARMQFKDKNGNFTGRPPANLPRDMVMMFRAELMDRLTAKRREVLVEMQDVLISVAKNGEKDADRIKAATAIIERELGKTPDKVEISNGDTPFEVAVGMAKVRRGPRPSSEG